MAGVQRAVARPITTEPLTIRLNLRAPKVVLITGAGSGIGRGHRARIRQDKATAVVVTDLDELIARETVSSA
jgi:FlaA1/EpsC-like NDP-sugar epimerase